MKPKQKHQYAPLDTTLDKGLFIVLYVIWIMLYLCMQCHFTVHNTKYPAVERVSVKHICFFKLAQKCKNVK